MRRLARMAQKNAAAPLDVPAQYHNVLMAIASAAIIDDDFCAHDVIETLQAFGFGSIVTQARKREALR
jgi:hypothetical protein